MGRHQSEPTYTRRRRNQDYCQDDLIFEVLEDKAQPDVILAENEVPNDSSSELITIQLDGKYTKSIIATAESKMFMEVASKIGGSIDIFTASIRLDPSTTSRQGRTQSEKKSVDFSKEGPC